MSPRLDRIISMVVRAVPRIMAGMFPQPALRCVSRPRRNTPSRDPPVREKTWYANHRMFSTGPQAQAIRARTRPKPATASLETQR